LGVVLAESKIQQDQSDSPGSKKKKPRKQNKCLNCKQPGESFAFKNLDGQHPGLVASSRSLKKGLSGLA
jgi:hypothetical protein